uniref:PdxA family dehydrogenase n=1 Tax=Pararhizobium sp. IMCC3301 TaxID=3067904 RepID=UPI002740AE2A|nr:4-hydroxythreonine-4-phosphate dehydrogenase PdxA [Pararhizobium sp. IMCC3301]
MTDTPVIFTTLGDAGGIGPELVARSLTHKDITQGVKRLIVGPRALYESGCKVAGTEPDLTTFDSVEEAINDPCPIALVDCNPTDFAGVGFGESSKAAGTLDLALGRYAADLYKDGIIDGFVFAPVNKVSLKMGGSNFEGYKAYIADYMGETGPAAEINTIGHLWTTRVSSHVSIAEVPSYITRENVLRIIRYFDRELRRFGYDNPKIAVSGLNPHNGDGGMFGREEIDAIGPAVEDARQHQINVAGPYPPDTIFLTVRQEDYLGVVSMYHDQCQIATKLMGFDEGVTYFGGLPYPITTPAHGTAYDIAGSGKASETPMVNALKLMRRAALTAKGMPV